MTKTVYYYKQDGTLVNIELTGIMLSEQLPVATLYVNGHLINFYWQSDVSYDDFVEQGYLLSEGKELADFYHVKFLVFYASEEIAKKAKEDYAGGQSYLELANEFNAINLEFKGENKLQAQFGFLPNEIKSAVTVYHTMVDLGSRVKTAEVVLYQAGKPVIYMPFEDFYSKYEYLGGIYLDFHERLGV